MTKHDPLGGLSSRLLGIDRRWLYLLIFLVVIMALAGGFEVDIGVTPPTVSYYRAIDALPAGATILLSMDIDGSTLPELEPMLRATIRHAFERGVRVIGLALLMEGVSIGERLLIEAAEALNDEYAEAGGERRITMGEDWVYLGYRAGNEAVLLGLGTEIRHVFSRDFYGFDLDSYPLMVDIHNYDDLGLISTVSGTNWPEYWVAFAGTPFDIPVLVGCTAVSAPQYYAFLQTGQMTGMLGGLKGAAEYERLMNRPGLAGRAMAAQLAVHVLIVMLIVLGNVVFFFERLRRRRLLQAVE